MQTDEKRRRERRGWKSRRGKGLGQRNEASGKSKGGVLDEDRLLRYSAGNHLRWLFIVLPWVEYSALQRFIQEPCHDKMNLAQIDLGLLNNQPEICCVGI